MVTTAINARNHHSEPLKNSNKFYHLYLTTNVLPTLTFVNIQLTTNIPDNVQFCDIHFQAIHY